MLKLRDYVDLIVPRGGERLIHFVAENSHIPVVKHYKGVCHTYVSAKADVKMAEDICFNAKVQRPGVCNAMETMLVHSKIAEKFLPSMLCPVFTSDPASTLTETDSVSPFPPLKMVPEVGVASR